MFAFSGRATVDHSSATARASGRVEGPRGGALVEVVPAVAIKVAEALALSPTPQEEAGGAPPPPNPLAKSAPAELRSATRLKDRSGCQGELRLYARSLPVDPPERSLSAGRDASGNLLPQAIQSGNS